VYNGMECFIYGLRTSGYFDLRKLDGTKIHASASWKKLKKIEGTKTLLIERRRMWQFLSDVQKIGVSLP
jgi:hypothetical protein